MDVPCPVIEQDEVVSSAIHFCETQHERDFNDGWAFVISGDVPDAKTAGPVILSEPQRSRRIPRNYPWAALRDSSTSLGMTESSAVARSAFDDYLFRRE